MNALSSFQMEQVNGGNYQKEANDENWQKEAICGMGLGALMGYSLSFAAIPGGYLAAATVCLITSGIIAISCHGWAY